MTVVAILNPISGARANPAAAADRSALLRAEAARRRLDVEIHLTERAGHARDLAAAAAASGAPLVIAWGGDGTLNEVGSALVGTPTVLGLVPAGSGNGLAAALGVPADPAAALAAAFDGPTRAIDVGSLAGRAFFNVAGIGFDAHVARLFNERPRGRRGQWPYFSIGLSEFWRYPRRTYTLDFDGVTRATQALLIVFANGREYGSGARIAPDAVMDDGLLDAVVVDHVAAPRLLWHVRHLVRGTIARAAPVKTTRVRHAVVETDGPIEYHVDGEPGVADGRVEVSIRPRALTVRVRGGA